MIVYAKAYNDLESERPIHMSGVGLIPWSKIVQYGQFHAMTQDQIYFLIEAIGKVDAKYIYYQAKEQKAQMNKGKK